MIETRTCSSVLFAGLQLSLRSSVCHVPSRLRQILPSSYKFGLTGPLPLVQLWKKASGACCGYDEPRWKSITKGAIFVRGIVGTDHKDAKKIKPRLPGADKDSWRKGSSEDLVLLCYPAHKS